MFKMILGSILIFIRPLAQAFFNHYHGTHIHHTFLLYILSILLIPLGLYLGYDGTQDRLDKKKVWDMKAQLPLKEYGQKIIVNYDDCRFSKNQYEVTNIVSPPVTVNGLSDWRYSTGSLYHEKELILYADRNDRTHYYFDLLDSNVRPYTI
jgi:hypothetical protein